MAKSRSKKTTSIKGTGCLALFALPFAGVGVFMTWLLVSTLIEHQAMRGWEEVPCRIIKAELKVSHGDDSTTYKATATYGYVYGDREYTGTRVSLHGGNDNIGSFHQDVHEELDNHRKSGEPFRCFVDPEQPGESILYRRLRWEMLAFYSLFALVFGGVGFGLLIGGLFGIRKSRTEAASKQDHPEEPWQWKEDWAAGRVRSSSKTLMWSALAFAFFWNLVSAPLWFVLPGEVLDKGNRLALLGALFPIVGMGLAFWALRAVLRWRKFGESVFEMAETPGVVGGKLAGVIHTTTNIDPQKGFQVSLRCIRRHVSGSGKSRSTHETILWQDERVMTRELSEHDFAKSAIPVLFGIPYDQPPSDDRDSSNKVIWRLEVKAAVPGIDYAATFDVPVFRTAESSPDFELDESLIADYAAPPNPELDLKRSGVIKALSPTGPEMRFVFPMARHFGAALGLTVFFAVWTGAIVLMVHLEAPLFFPIVFGLIDLFVAYGVADLWFYRSVVDVSRYEVAVTGGLFGLGSTRRVPISEISEVRAERGMQSGSTVFETIVFRLEGGRKITAGKRIKSKPLAKAVIRELETAMGRETPDGTTL